MKIKKTKKWLKKDFFPNLNNWQKRVLTSLLILLFILPIFFITSSAGVAGRWIGLLIYSAAAVITSWELFIKLKINKVISIIMSIFIILFFFLPFDKNMKIILNDNLSNYNIVFLVNLSFYKMWMIYLPILLVSISSALLEYKKLKINFIKEIIIKQIILMFSLTLIVIFFKFLWTINCKSVLPILFFLSITIISDTFGYLGGIVLGNKIFRKKLAPNISPKKTWEGALIGWIFALTFSIAIGYSWNIWSFYNTTDSGLNVLFILFVSLLLTILSPIGDLLFSLFKRIIGIKDFSNFLPGHGGILDRIDSSLFVIFFSLIFYLYM